MDAHDFATFTHLADRQSSMLVSSRYEIFVTLRDVDGPPLGVTRFYREAGIMNSTPLPTPVSLLDGSAEQ